MLAPPPGRDRRRHSRGKITACRSANLQASTTADNLRFAGASVWLTTASGLEGPGSRRTHLSHRRDKPPQRPHLPGWADWAKPFRGSHCVVSRSSARLADKLNPECFNGASVTSQLRERPRNLFLVPPPRAGSTIIRGLEPNSEHRRCLLTPQAPRNDCTEHVCAS